MSRLKLHRTEEQLKNHKEYIQKQFIRPLKPSFRDVIFHASFIKAVSDKLKDQKIELGEFLELELDNVKNFRNSLLHDVIHDKLTQQEIEGKIADMFIRFWPIYRSKAFTEFFNKEYDLNLMEITDKHLEFYRDEPASDTSGNRVDIRSSFISLKPDSEQLSKK